MSKVLNLLKAGRKWAFSHKKISLIILIVLLVLAFFMWPKNPPKVLTQEASYSDVVKTVSTTGKIDSDNTADLSFQSGGKLIYLGAKVGDYVKKGQAIASLDQTQLQASYRQAVQDFTAAKAASDQYYDGHKSTGESYPEKVTRTALDATQNKAYDQMMKVQNDLYNSTLYSPIDGILTRADTQSINVNVLPTTVFTVTDPTSLVFKMEVDESDIGNIKDNQQVEINLDSFPNDTLKVYVDQIDFVSHTTSSGGTAFYVKAKLPQNSAYRVGMSGNADIIVDKKEHVLAIPLSSVTDDNSVYVKVGNKYEKRKVKLGLQSDTLTEVLSGVSVGETVAVDPTSVPQNLIAKK